MATTPFYEIVFPVGYSYGAIGGCGWSTRLVGTSGGNEYRAQMWANTLGEWRVGHNIRQPADWAALMTFHRTVQGREVGFRFRDWTDYTAESAPGVGDRQGTVALDSNNALRLGKNYSITDLFANVFTTIRPIFKPEPGTVIVYAGSTSTPRSSYVLDYTTGIFTTVGDVQAGDTWAGQFHVPARFDVDRQDLDASLPLTGVGWKGIPIKEIRTSGLNINVPLSPSLVATEYQGALTQAPIGYAGTPVHTVMIAGWIRGFTD